MATRPDIAFSVSCLSQFNSCFHEQHWNAAKRVLRYLKFTQNFGISYLLENSWDLRGYVDADWASCVIDRRSYTGHCFLLYNGCVTWESKKQRTPVLSSLECEYMGLTEGAKEAAYLKQFLNEIQIRICTAVKLGNDNQGAKSLATNPASGSKTKHIDLRYHFIRTSVTNGIIDIEYVPSDKMPADILTKGLTKEKHYRCLNLLKLEDTLLHSSNT